MIENKQCAKCRQIKAINSFYKGKKYVDSYCKPCRCKSSSRHRSVRKSPQKYNPPREPVHCFSCKKEFLAAKRRKSINAYCSKVCRYGGASERYRFHNELKGINTYEETFDND